MAANLLSSLYISGAGAAAASGTVNFYGVGTLVPATVFSDDALTQTLVQPIVLDSSGKTPLPVYTTIPLRAIIKSSAGATLQDIARIDGDRAELVAISNVNTTATDMNTYISTVAASTGGVDARFLEGSAGSVARSIQAKFAETQISVKDFGATGNGITDDTTAIQAAANRVNALGGGILYFPPGTYLVSTQITCGNNTQILGAGFAATVVKGTTPAGNLFIQTGNFSIVRNIQLTNSNGLGGGGVALTMGSNTDIYNVVFSNFVTNISIAASTVNVYDSALNQATNHSLGAGTVIFTNSTFGTGAFTATTFFTARTSLATAGSGATNLSLYQASTADCANGGTVTPVVGAVGQVIAHQRIRGTSAGGGTVNATATPFGNTQILVLDCFNNSGGAFLFTLNAQYKNAGNPNPANGSRTAVAFSFDITGGFWIEVGRATST